jgi:antitoxin VapB
MSENNHLTEEHYKSASNRVFDRASWIKTSEKQRHKTKIFKSGNSLAVRIPAGTDLVAGMEMELVIDHGQFLSYEPVDKPKRKFNIAKVAGSGKGLKYIDRGDRSFEPRPSSVNVKPRAE